MDKVTLIRSMSYTPAGLFNHTAAIYQMLTGYPPDKVSPSGQLEPPRRATFPTAGSHISKLKPLDGPMLPFVEMPRPLQESASSAKAARPASWARPTIPTASIRTRTRQFDLDDLALRADVPPERLKDRFYAAEGDQRLDAGAREGGQLLRPGRVLPEGVRPDSLGQGARTRSIWSRKAGQAARPVRPHTFGQGALLARRLIEAGTRFVQVNWPSVANGDPTLTAWDTHASNFGPLKNLHCPMLDSALSALLEDMDERGMLEETLVVAVGEFGRSARAWASAPPATPTLRTAATTGRTATRRWSRAPASSRGVLYGKSDEHGFVAQVRIRSIPPISWRPSTTRWASIRAR